MATRNMTNGTCFDPKQARYEREKQAMIQAERDKEADRVEHVRTMREHGRMLDQIEACYRQHTPAQNQYDGPKVVMKGGMIFTEYEGMTVDAPGVSLDLWRGGCFDALVDCI